MAAREDRTEPVQAETHRDHSRGGLPIRRLTLPRSVGARAALAHALLVALAAGVFAPVAVGGGEIAAAAVVLALAASSIGMATWLAWRSARTAQAAADAARSLADDDEPPTDYSPAFDRLGDSPDLADAFARLADALRRRGDDTALERRLLAAVMETTSEGVIALDSQNAVRMMNQAAQRLLMTDLDYARGRPLAEIERDFEMLQVAARSADTRRMHRAQIELLHPRRFLTVTATPLLGGSLLTIQDATDERRAQTTRREFVSNVSHELRSPLASVRAMVETLENGAIDDREATLDFLSRIQDDIARMTALVNELLELSSLESGQMPVHLSPVSARETAAAAAERLSAAAAAKGVEMRCAVSEDAPLIMADPAKLDQILTNLLENALRFTPPGGRVEISAGVRAQWVDISVSDTGVGISPEHLPRVFERFFKADRARRDGGTGLGLAIAKHLAQAHGGEMRAESAEGEGSAFTVTLRRAT